MDDNGSSSEAPDKQCTARHREVGSVVDKDAHTCSVGPARRRAIAIVAVSRVHATPSNEDIDIDVVRRSRIYRKDIVCCLDKNTVFAKTPSPSKKLTARNVGVARRH